MKNPKVSVVMAVYNTEKYLKESIESILNQTYTDFEFIIINDGSTDDSPDIIKKYVENNPRIIFLQNETNLWISKTRNKWLKEAKWEYIANFDSDDIALPNWIETQIDFLEKNSQIDVCGANINFIDKEWKKTLRLKYPEKDKDIKASLYFINPFVHSTVVIRKNCLDTIWFYNEKLKNAEDLDLWFRLYDKGFKFHNNQKYLVNYRVHWANSIIKQRKEMIENTVILLKKNNFFKKISFNKIAIKFFIISFIKYSYVIFLTNLKNRISK